MKQIIFGMINIFLIILFVILLLIIGENGVRRLEVNTNLSNSIATTMSNYVRGEGAQEYDKEQWIAKLLEGMIIQASDTESISVSINELDMNKGIISASVEEEFIYANGNKTSREGNRTAIIDRKETTEKEKYSLTYFCDIYENGEMVSIPFCKYELVKGEKCIYPDFPEIDGYAFSHAVFSDGGEVLTVDEGGMLFVKDNWGRTAKISRNIEIHGVYKNV